jgi:thymidylate synthase ThyX
MGMTDKTAARKQARGAARGYLGNALASDMLFTTSVTGWKWILSQRKNKLADAEIREVYTPAWTALQSSSTAIASPSSPSSRPRMVWGRYWHDASQGHGWPSPLGE